MKKVLLAMAVVLICVTQIMPLARAEAEHEMELPAVYYCEYCVTNREGVDDYSGVTVARWNRSDHTLSGTIAVRCSVCGNVFVYKPANFVELHRFPTGSNYCYMQGRGCGGTRY